MTHRDLTSTRNAAAPARQRVVVVVGAGRSGTSTLTRGVGALGVELGDRLKPPGAKNPKGFFEDLDLLDINRRVSRLFGLTTTGSDVRPVDADRFGCAAVLKLRGEAAALMRRRFGSCPVWGFKSGGVLRLLPFWHGVFDDIGARPSYVVALRHPLSVARSRSRLNPLRGHQEKSDLEWLSRMVPYFHLIRPHPFTVVDYDRLMVDPVRELHRVAAALALPVSAEVEQTVRAFAEQFVTADLQHHRAPGGCQQLDALTALAYQALLRLATDELAPDSAAFWDQWRRVESGFELLGPALRHIDFLERSLRGVRWGIDDKLRIAARRVSTWRPGRAQA